MILTLATLLAACGEPNQQATDLPPQIVDAVAEADSTITLEEGGTVVWVVAYDEDMESIGFIWTLSEWGEIPSEEVTNSLESSQITLDQDMALDGQTLSCEVFDATSSEAISWSLFVPR